MTDNQLSLIDVFNYELKASCWAPFVGNPFLQGLAAKYFVWKAKRKFKRYANFLQMERELKKLRATL